MDVDLITLLGISSGLVCTGATILLAVYCRRRVPEEIVVFPQDWR